MLLHSKLEYLLIPFRYLLILHVQYSSLLVDNCHGLIEVEPQVLGQMFVRIFLLESYTIMM
jgi:hypothetical protein